MVNPDHRETGARNLAETARKLWSDPELVEFAVDEVTAGNPTVGDDGLGAGS